MRYGTVTRYFADKGFGFIRTDDGADVFFHVSVLEGEPPSEIAIGQAVKYELEPRGGSTARRERDGARTGTGGRRAATNSTPLRAARVELIERLPGGNLDDVAGKRTVARHPRARRKKPGWR